MAATFEHGSRTRAALAAIVADPSFGPQTLSSPAALSNLLSDYLPDSPRETGPLLAAAQADLPGTLRDHVARGMACPTAIQLAAASLAARTSFSDQACLWVASELAVALGLATDDQLPGFLSPGEVNATRPAAPGPAAETDPVLVGPVLVSPVLVGPAAPGPAAETDPMLLPPAGLPRRPDQHNLRPGRSHGPWTWLAAVTTGAVVVVAGASLIVLLSRHHVSAQHRPPPSHSHSTPGPTPSPTPTPTPSVADPALVAREYVADVNGRDWPLLWQLGGGNVELTYQPNPGPYTYRQMVANFRHTVSVTITSLTSAGDTVSMHVNALDSAGATQFFEIDLVVSGDRIVSGSQYFLGA